MPMSSKTARNSGYPPKISAPPAIGARLLTQAQPHATRSRPALVAVLLILGTLGASPILARTPEVHGWIEKVRLQPWDMVVKAKLDTGAKSSAIHARSIQRFDKDGEEWVRFQLAFEHRNENGETIVVEKPVVKETRIKLRGKKKIARRPTVEMEFCMGEKRYKALFGLTDRARFNYPVLLGRRFMRDLILVDPGATFQRNARCPQ